MDVQSKSSMLVMQIDYHTSWVANFKCIFAPPIKKKNFRGITIVTCKFLIATSIDQSKPFPHGFT